MHFQNVVKQLKNVPLFEIGLLYAGADKPQQVQRQLADWTRSGKVIQLRRGLYTLAAPYRSKPPHSYLIANQLVQGSYVSLQMALSQYDLIPEHVAVVTSVTTGRPGKWQNPYGRFSYQHIQPAFFFGFYYGGQMNVDLDTMLLNCSVWIGVKSISFPLALIFLED